MTTWKQWAAGMVQSVADAAKQRRTALRWSAAEVSEKTAVGKPLSRAVISDLETGRKQTLDISELVTLAVALEVSPLTLLVPDVTADVEILPGVLVPGIDVVGWWAGIGGVTDGQGRDVLGKDAGTHNAIALAEVEKTLRLNRIALQIAERTYVMYERESDRDAVDQKRRRVALLEEERQRLTDLYRRTAGGDDA